MSRQEMADLFGVSDLGTITRWRRDPRVKAHAMKLIEDRVLQVTRKVDSEIAQRLEEAEQMSLMELLAIRKEFLGGALRSQTENADEAVVQEAQKMLEDNPDLLAALDKILAGE